MYRLVYTDRKYNVRKKYEDLLEAFYSAVQTQRPTDIRVGKKTIIRICGNGEIYYYT